MERDFLECEIKRLLFNKGVKTMSRSYKEPWVTCGYGTKSKKYAKNQANRRVRYAGDVPNGGKYRLYYDSWDICDFKFFYRDYPIYRWVKGKQEEIPPEPQYKWNRK
jgi:hypothetical protein